MQGAIAALTLLTQLGGGYFAASVPNVSPITHSLRLPQSVESPSLLRLTGGQPWLFAGQPQRQSRDGEPMVTQIYPVKANILAVEIETGAVIYGEQQPYESQPGDRVTNKNIVKRNGQRLGKLVGAEQDMLYTFDQYRGTEISSEWLQNSRNYRLSSPTAGDADGEQPTEVFYKRKPTDMADTANGKRWPMRHTVYLQLAEPLAIGQTYELTFQGQPLAPQRFTYNPQRQHSEAVHVSHIGFRPDDPVKVGFLSTWMGSGGGVEYADGLDFWLIDTQTEAIAYQGQTQLAVSQDTPEDPYRNYNGTDVYTMDFQDFQTAGTYRLCVETVGCSVDFPIQETVWETPFITSMSGLYHQRSGIELGPPYTQYERPRAFHPDDGVVVYQSTAKLMDTKMGIGSAKPFEALKEGVTETIVPDAWGGYFDAGDWDRRIQHLSVAQSLLDLVEFFPDQMATLALNLPESDNDLPDVLDEALWGIDFFRRLQHDDGGIPGGIESAAHPQSGEASWQESLKVMAYAPDIWSSYWYAATAAQAAIALQPWDAEKAAVYEQSALDAFAYAEAQYPNAPKDGWPRQVLDRRNFAALSLWRLTQRDRFHQTFLDTTVFTDPDQPAIKHKQHNQVNAAFLYARLGQPGLDPQVQANARRAFLQQADKVAKLTQQTAFQWTKHDPYAPIGWGTTWASPYAADTLIRAHYLTTDERYLADAIRASQAALGANPDNMVYTTGLGQRSPQHPLIVDQRIMGVAPPPGITVYGPIDLSRNAYQDYWFTRYQMSEQMYPAPPEWPTMELHVDVHINVAMSEFTVQQTIGPAAYVWGYLAAQD
jgi:endoglucanase